MYNTQKQHGVRRYQTGNGKDIAKKKTCREGYARRRERSNESEVEEGRGTLHHLKHRGLQDAEVCLVLRKLGPANDLAPVHRVRFLLPGTGE